MSLDHESIRLVKLISNNLHPDIFSFAKEYLPDYDGYLYLVEYLISDLNNQYFSDWNFFMEQFGNLFVIIFFRFIINI